jgi:hypothetical protein
LELRARIFEGCLPERSGGGGGVCAGHFFLQMGVVGDGYLSIRGADTALYEGWV